MLNLASSRVRLGGKQRGLQLFKAVGVPGPSNAYRDAVLADSPLAYWRLSESSGTTMLDSSGNGRDGTYTGVSLGVPGAVTSGDTAIATTGLSTSHGDVLYAPWMNGLTAVTVEAWVKTNVTTGSRVAVGRNATSPAYSIGVSNTNATFAKRSVITSTVTGTINVADNAWHHIVGVWDGAIMYLYVDGNLDGTTSVGGALTTALNDLQIGGRGAAYFAGSTDEAAIYDHALTPTRIAAHYAAGIAG